ncbi:MAG: transglycosylase domain-containing protein [Butyribacter sp.]|nr:transglycosylase domain-containing protein [bacterium]MDY3855432.1 transglycosylase domain-containing protein [Butyribacter sp.]
MTKIKEKVQAALRIVFGALGNYIGIISNVFGAMLGILASVLVVCVIAGICIYVKVLPMFTEAREEVFDKLVNMSEEDFIMSEDTVIYDKEGKKIGSVNTGRYEYVSIQKISPYIYDGYIAVEDKRFKTHGGVDVLATMRAGVALLKNNMEITQGGSTITQQVIKNNLLTQDKSFTRKIAEILLAPSVEQKFTKDKIMEFYCNSNFYGNRCYGVEAASQYYFGKKCADLEPHEAAVLIGLSNAPSAYDPVANPEASLKKRNEILAIMQKENVITQKEYQTAVKKKLKVLQITEDGTNESYITSYAIHCAAIALMEKEEFPFQYTFSDKEDYEEYQDKYSVEYSQKCNEIRSGGYKLYTSIDMKKQKRLQKAVNNGLAYNKEKNKETGKYALQGAAVCVDNETNYVVAIVGGRGTKDAYNRAYLSARQSGSAIKPLIDYAPGFESGVYSPSTLMTDKPIANGPKNAGGGYRGKVRVREAVARSINTIAWQVLDTITPKYGMSFLDKMQFHNLSYVDNDNLALSLGGFTEGVRVVDMAKGYATLANGGSYSDRTCIRKIEHVSDGVVYKNSENTTQVYSEDAAWLMTDVLKGVMNESYGTGHAVKLANNQICAGKTGTTNSGKDVWFCGYTKYYTTVVWAGYDTPRAMPGASGASITGRIWKNYMDGIHKNLTPLDFTIPETICLAKYNAAGKIVSGTETAATKRTAGKDYFSTKILEETEEYAAELKEKQHEKTVLKKLKAFEEMTIESLADYYEFVDTYNELRDLISAITDDDVRKTYATRAKNKYDSLKDDTADWKKAATAYEKAKKEENQLLAKEKAKASKTARQKELRESRIKLAKTRIKLLQTYTVKPANVEELISQAKEALEACKKYSEYTGLKVLYDKNVAYIMNLPESTNSMNNQTNNSTSAPQQTQVPSGTPGPSLGTGE